MGKQTDTDINEEDDNFVDELKPGTQLMHGQYTIESFLNAGGFGITYLARDSLDRKIVIKECFPGAFCRRSRAIVQARSRAHQNELQSIVRLFVQEAKSLAKLNHPNIVGVHQVFEDNDTAYMALDFVEGRDMLDTMDDPEIVMTPEQIKSMLVDVLGAVQFIHDQDILHRDISPDNILIDPDGRPVLIDFGAAREQATKQSRVLSALRVVKDGYSPQEFYIAGSEQNASSDLYALGASFYHFIKGDCPPNSQARLAAIASDQPDPYEALEGTMRGYDDNFLAAIDKSLGVLPKDRLQSARDWIDMMEGREPGQAPVAVASDPIGEAVAATAPANESKSKTGLLLASAAVIAVVGIGAAMTLGGDVEPAEEQTAVVDTEAEAAEALREAEMAAAAQAAEEAGRVAAAEAAAKQQAEQTAEAERQARAQAEAEAAQLRSALAEAQANAERQRVAREEEIARLADENAQRLAEQAAAREVAQAEAIAEAKSAAEAQALAEAQARAAEEARVMAQALAAEEEARRSAEAEAEAAEEAARQSAVIAAEAQARADAAALAAATLDTPTPPLDAVTAMMLTSVSGAPQMPLAAFNSQLPTDVSLGNAIAEAERSDFGLSGEEFTNASFQFSDGIPAFAPGNEVVQPVADTSIVLSTWSVDLPFEGANSSSRVIGSIATVAPLWVNTGVEIDSVNGQAIESISGIDDVLRGSVDLTDEKILPVTFGVKEAGSDETVEQQWSLPVVQKTALLNGVEFETRMIDDAWVTKVINAPAEVSGDLQTGDEIIAYMRTSETVDGRTSIKTILDRELEAGTTQFNFAVNREGSMWIASLDYAGSSQ